MKAWIQKIQNLLNWLDYLSPLSDLILRFYVGMVFWESGLVKLSNMGTTIWLFQNEYAVPILPPAFAAYLSMVTELTFSALLMIGLLGRFSAFSLFFINLVAVLSYPNLHAAGVDWHIAWGVMLLIPIFYGPGKISLDHLLWPKIQSRA